MTLLHQVRLFLLGLALAMLPLGGTAGTLLAGVQPQAEQVLMNALDTAMGHNSHDSCSLEHTGAGTSADYNAGNCDACSAWIAPPTPAKSIQLPAPSAYFACPTTPALVPPLYNLWKPPRAAVHIC